MSGFTARTDIEGVPVAAKIGDEHFHLAAGKPVANLLNGAGKDARAAIRLIVAIHAGDHGVTQAHARSSFRDAQRLVLIGRAGGLAGRHGAEATGARTNIAEDHEGGRAMFPALAHVRAARGFANGVEVEGAHDALQVVVAIAAEELHAQPVGPRMGVRRRHRGHVAVGDDVKGRGHGYEFEIHILRGMPGSVQK